MLSILYLKSNRHRIDSSEQKVIITYSSMIDSHGIVLPQHYATVFSSPAISMVVKATNKLWERWRLIAYCFNIMVGDLLEGIHLGIYIKVSFFIQMKICCCFFKRMIVLRHRRYVVVKYMHWNHCGRFVTLAGDFLRQVHFFTNFPLWLKCIRNVSGT